MHAAMVGGGALRVLFPRPLFGRLRETMCLSKSRETIVIDTTDFPERGFLSTYAAESRASLNPAFEAPYAKVLHTVEACMAQLKLLEKFQATAPQSDMALGYWLRCLEASQGAVLLADFGMPGASRGSWRLALECLFFAAAGWREPQEFEKEMSVALNSSLRGLVNAMPQRLKDAFKARLGPEVMSLFHGLGKLEGESKRLYQRMAELADMKDYYETYYRFLSATGAHASPISAAKHREILPGKVELVFSPQHNEALEVWKGVRLFLDIGMQRFESDLLTQLSPRPNQG